MRKNMIFRSGKCKRGLQVYIGKWKRPYEKVAWGEENLAITTALHNIASFSHTLTTHCTLTSMGMLIYITYLKQLYKLIITRSISYTNC
jgi:hypothetical protein